MYLFQRTFGLKEGGWAGRDSETASFETTNSRETMRPKRFLATCLLIESLDAAVASCATRGGSFPPAPNLKVQPKPVPRDEVATSRVAGKLYDNAVEAWGQAGWAKVARLYRFFDLWE